jgi:hypothetical protein
LCLLSTTVFAGSYEPDDTSGDDSEEQVDAEDGDDRDWDDPDHRGEGDHRATRMTGTRRFSKSSMSWN